jgi:hypothetical protein
MGLTNCPDCDYPISTTANFCVKCGWVREFKMSERMLYSFWTNFGYAVYALGSISLIISIALLVKILI